jgi:hypothetical protein
MEMKYAYDVVLNFNDKFYNFYEWNTNDTITYVKKIPIYKVTNGIINEIITNNISLDVSFIETIPVSYIYKEMFIEKVYGLMIMTSTDSSIALNFDNNGKVLKISDIMLDDLEEITNLVNKMKYTNIKYEVLSKKEDRLVIRNDVNMYNFINNKIDSINNKDEIKYIYYECFLKNDCNNINDMKKNIKKYYTKDPEKLYKLLMLYN